MVMQIEEITKRGILTQSEAAECRGKVVYAEGQVFAMQSALRPRALAHRATGRDRMKVKHNRAAMAAS